MRVSPQELRAVRAGGLLTRYALLGEAAFVIAEVPQAGSAGTSLEEPCEQQHWAIVLQGELILHGRHSRAFGVGSAFYVAPGRTHRFTATPSAVIAGFAPVTEPFDDSPAGLRSRGIEVVRRAPVPAMPPSEVRIAGTRARAAVTGDVQTVSAVMGPWLFTRSTFGPMSGFADGWCDLPHWGQIIDGTLVLRWEDGELELLGAGDVFSCPGGAVGHRFEAAEAATMIDYTPTSAVRDPGLRRAPRAVSALRVIVGPGPADERAERDGTLPAPERVPGAG